MTALPTVACYSYLAATHTLNVQAYPRIDYGTEILSAEHFLAGDGPLVAAFLHALGHPVLLGTNSVGDDPAGHSIRERLHQWGVRLAPNDNNAARTRTNIVICDQAGHRTWFSDLAGIPDELGGLNIEPLADCPILYLDGYEVLATAPRPLLQAAFAAGSQVFLNLGGSPPPAWLTAVTRHRRLSFLQTNASEDDPRSADRTLDFLTDLNVADTVIVTVGRRGAVARGRSRTRISAPASPVTVRQVQGAGAAFSAALIHAHNSELSSRSAEEQLRLACTAGSLWCARTPDSPLPTREEVIQLTAS